MGRQSQVGERHMSSDWMDYAACADMPITSADTDPFFYPDGADAGVRATHDAAAAAVCAQCPVTMQCDAAADAMRVRDGFWGGRNELERLLGWGYVHREGKLRPPRPRDVRARAKATESVEVTG